MKSILLLSLTLFLSACGSDGNAGLNGLVGQPGNNGPQGEPGYNSLINIAQSSAIDSLVCLSQSGVLLQSGLDTNRNTVLDIDEVQSIGVVCDGAVGPAGPQGPQGDPGNPASVPQYSVKEVIDPCGDDAGAVDEVLLRLQNGSILVMYTQSFGGAFPRLAILAPGSYVTTDTTNCSFSINANFILTDANNNTFYP